MFNQTSAQPDSTPDPYQGVAIVLLALTVLGTVGAMYGSSTLENPDLLDVAVTLSLSAGILIGVAWTRHVRARPPKSHDRPMREAPLVESETAEPSVPPASDSAPERSRLSGVRVWARRWFRDLGEIGTISVATGAVGALVIVFELTRDAPAAYPVSPLLAGIAAALCLGAALASTVVHYLTDIEPIQLPEGPALARGARVVAWISSSPRCRSAWRGPGSRRRRRILHGIVMLINLAVCYGLLRFKPRPGETVDTFPLDFGVLSCSGAGRTSSRASSTARNGSSASICVPPGRSRSSATALEPLVIGLCLVAWLSTSLTVVGVGEQGLVERLGVPVGGPPLQPGLHLHWPWPVDRVFRIPVQRVQVLTVGHEGEERGGPEDVLWAVQHAANEYTLLLGNGRDLITVDAAVQFRIADARAWRYHSQNPGDALRAIAYRAVMRTTVNRTLADALSENVVTTTARMRTMVQQDADALGLGVEVLGFTVGGMHPPVLVASDYQAVVSAELGKVTAVVNAQALRNQTVPAAEASVLASENSARAQGAGALARATGEAWSFLTLQAQYRAASPEDYVFRRRLETLEKTLAGRRFTVVDSPFSAGWR